MQTYVSVGMSHAWPFMPLPSNGAAREVRAHAADAGQCIVSTRSRSMLLEASALELAKLQELRAAGVCVAIDDFGTGYSSLSRISELPVDTLKIDQSFVARLQQDESGKTLVQTVVSLARAFKMESVAASRPVAQLEALQEMGCDQLQSFLMSKPVPRDAFTSLLANGNGHILLSARRASGV